MCWENILCLLPLACWCMQYSAITLKKCISLYDGYRVFYMILKCTFLSMYSKRWFCWYSTLCFSANTVVVSCMDTCSLNNTTFPLCTFNNSCKRSLQQKKGNQTVLLKTIVNHSNFQDIPCICLSSSREQQSNTKYSESESSRGVNVDHQESRSIDKKSK